MQKRNEVDVLIRKADKTDMPAVVEMIKELANYENEPTGPKLSAEDLQRDGFDRQPTLFKCIVAEHLFQTGPRVIGYAVYFPIYSTWEGPALLLEDLYVTVSMRKRGVGRKLFNAIVKEAFQSNCSRLDFHALDWKEACAFYESMGAINLALGDRKTYYRMDKKALEAYGSAKSF